MAEVLAKSHTTPTASAGRPAATATTPARVRRQFGRATGFWIVAATTALLLAASSAATPLYPILQAQIGFSALTLTTIFAVYVLALLLSLLTVGRLSDFVGRRPVLAGALIVEAVAMAAFLDAGTVSGLMIARIVQGLATGAAMGVLGAYLLDLQPSNGSRLGSLVNSAAATGGLAVGLILTGFLVQFAPQPTKLVFDVLLVVFVLLLLAVIWLPESVSRTSGAVAALRPQVSIPVAARRAFLGATPVMIASWALGGLMLSVGGSVLGRLFDLRNEAVIGVVLGVFALSGAVASVVTTSLAPALVRRIGTYALLIGTAIFVLGLAVSSLWTFIVAALIAGAGFGAGFLGALRSVTLLAQPHERAGLLSAVYVVCYLAFSVPAVVAGLLIPHLGLHTTAVGYAAVVSAVTLISIALDRRTA